MKTEKTNVFSLRLPQWLCDKVKERSAASRMSMTQFIVTTLEDAVRVPTTGERLDETEDRLSTIEAQLNEIKKRLASLEHNQKDAEEEEQQ